MVDPIYTAANCTPAFQLRWSLALFQHQTLPEPGDWLEPLKQVVEKDGVRILEAQFRSPKSWLFLLSSAPSISPSNIVKSVKGRWQHLLRPSHSNAFQRNFSISSVGDPTADSVAGYIDKQLAHHGIKDVRLVAELCDFQWNNPGVDLNQPRFSAHGRYIYNLHLVFVHQKCWSALERENWETTRRMVRQASDRKGNLLSRLGLLPDHVHILLGCYPSESPQEVAFGYMIKLAFAHAMTHVFAFGYYSGTVGRYDMRAIWKNLE